MVESPFNRGPAVLVGLLPLLLATCATADLRPAARPRPAGPEAATPISARPVPAAASRLTISFRPDSAPVRAVISAIGAEVGPLPEPEVARSRTVIARAAASYPPALLARHLDRVVVVGRLAYQGVEVGGTYRGRHVFIANYGEAAGSTDAWLAECFHHELSSILLHANATRFPRKEWFATMPEGVGYGRGGFQAVKQGAADERIRAHHLRDGFLCQYGRSDFEEDFNTFAERLWTNPPGFWATLERHPAALAKARLAVRFFEDLDPSLDEVFFRAL